MITVQKKKRKKDRDREFLCLDVQTEFNLHIIHKRAV